MTEFQIKRSGRRCHGTGRELQPGEEFYSELLPLPVSAETDAAFERRDWSAEAWKGPAPEAIGWWRCRVPEREPGRVWWATNEVLKEYFHQLLASPVSRSRAWVMATLLVRRRILRMEGEIVDEEGTRRLVVNDPATGQEYRVPVVDLTLEERDVIQQEFAAQLFTDQPPA